MKPLRWCAALGSAALIATMIHALPARAEVDVDLFFRAGIPGPDRTAFRVSVSSPQPEYVVIPQSRVVAVRGCDHDVYRFDNFYWAYDDGYWFRARKIGGPWVAVRVERVPSAVLFVPATYRTRWVTVPVEYRVPPGHIRHEIREERREERRERKAAKHHWKKEHGH